MKVNTIAEVPSGTIDIVTTPDKVRIEFNCSCDDALPWCQAVCCRNRQWNNVLIEDDEKDKFDKAIPHPSQPQLTILQPENGHCGYFDSEGCRCKIHEDKPRQCGNWHCSPMGGGPDGTGEGITQRDQGFILLPTVISGE